MPKFGKSSLKFIDLQICPRTGVPTFASQSPYLHQTGSPTAERRAYPYGHVRPKVHTIWQAGTPVGANCEAEFPDDGKKMGGGFQCANRSAWNCETEYLP